MAWGDGRPQGNEEKSSSLETFPSPQTFHAGPLNITVQEEGDSKGILGRVVSLALVDGKIG
jgi:hypothetical protein